MAASLSDSRAPDAEAERDGLHFHLVMHASACSLNPPRVHYGAIRLLMTMRGLAPGFAKEASATSE